MMTENEQPTEPHVEATVVRRSNDAEKTIGIAGVWTNNPITVRTMPIVAMIGVRVLRVYIQTFLGLLGADGIGAIELARPGDAWGHLISLGLVSLAPATVSLLHNALEFLTSLDVKRPELRA
jgi:hypothetical protein